MSIWREDFTTSSLEDVLGQQSENRAWSKELRRKTTTLVNSRLANAITQDDYLTTRKLTTEETMECRRRATILESQIASRGSRSLPRPR